MTACFPCDLTFCNSQEHLSVSPQTLAGYMRLAHAGGEQVTGASQDTSPGSLGLGVQTGGKKPGVKAEAGSAGSFQKDSKGSWRCLEPLAVLR